jgi:long-chain acyl-CoA synthetase
MTHPTRLFDFIFYQKEKYPLSKSISHINNGIEDTYSTDDIIRLGYQFAHGLLTYGLHTGDKIGLVTFKNRPEWVIAELGASMCGIITVPVYPTISQNEYAYIFNDSEIKCCFIGDDENDTILKKIAIAEKECPTLKNIYTFDKVSNAKHWKEFLTEGDNSVIDTIKEKISPKEMATIIYTSGTTGEPKGVMLSHENIGSNSIAVIDLIPVGAGERTLSFLPINHIFERTCLYAIFYKCAEINFTGTDNLGGEDGDLKRVQPNFFTTVPRLLEKVYEKIYNKGLELKGIKRSLFFWALRLTNDYEIGKEYGFLKSIKMKIADKLIFSKWREALGGHIKGIIIGASPCPVKIARTFCAAGIPIREGYGLTETSPGICINRMEPGAAMLGTVGPTVPGIEIYIDPSDGNYKPGEGEILCDGPNIMMGYYKKPDKTAEVFKTIDGKRWFCTGDIGKIIPKGKFEFLQITDRKKELLKTSGGKYVAPSPIENKLKENYLIEQIMVVGDNKKFVSALIVPGKEALKDWCNQHNIAWTTDKEIFQNEAVLAKYQEVIDKYNPNFNAVEQIKAFRLVTDTWEPVKSDGSTGELTPTQKLKRRVLLEKYAVLIKDIYGEE